MATDAMRLETDAGEVAHATARGVIAAMAMSGMRAFTVSVGLVDQTPPEAIAKQKARGLLRRVPKKRRQAVIQLIHWGVGAVGGAIFGVLPERVRRRAWAGPAYGLAILSFFEVVVAPALGLSQAKRPRPVERLTLAGDHLLYGLVLSETRSRPRE